MALTRYQRAYRNHHTAGGAIDLFQQGVITEAELAKSARLVAKELKRLKAARNPAANTIPAIESGAKG